jgi:hypothetical protein
MRRNSRQNHAPHGMPSGRRTIFSVQRKRPQNMRIVTHMGYFLLGVGAWQIS